MSAASERGGLAAPVTISPTKDLQNISKEQQLKRGGPTGDASVANVCVMSSPNNERVTPGSEDAAGSVGMIKSEDNRQPHIDQQQYSYPLTHNQLITERHIGQGQGPGYQGHPSQAAVATTGRPWNADYRYPSGSVPHQVYSSMQHQQINNNRLPVCNGVQDGFDSPASQQRLEQQQNMMRQSVAQTEHIAPGYFKPMHHSSEVVSAAGGYHFVRGSSRQDGWLEHGRQSIDGMVRGSAPHMDSITMQQYRLASQSDVNPQSRDVSQRDVRMAGSVAPVFDGSNTRFAEPRPPATNLIGGMRWPVGGAARPSIGGGTPYNMQQLMYNEQLRPNQQQWMNASADYSPQQSYHRQPNQFSPPFCPGSGGVRQGFHIPGVGVLNANRAECPPTGYISVPLPKLEHFSPGGRESRDATLMSLQGGGRQQPVFADQFSSQPLSDVQQMKSPPSGEFVHRATYGAYGDPGMRHMVLSPGSASQRMMAAYQQNMYSPSICRQQASVAQQQQYMYAQQRQQLMQQQLSPQYRPGFSVDQRHYAHDGAESYQWPMPDGVRMLSPQQQQQLMSHRLNNEHMMRSTDSVLSNSLSPRLFVDHNVSGKQFSCKNEPMECRSSMGDDLNVPGDWSGSQSTRANHFTGLRDRSNSPTRRSLSSCLSSPTPGSSVDPILQPLDSSFKQRFSDASMSSLQYSSPELNNQSASPSLFVIKNKKTSGLITTQNSVSKIPSCKRKRSRSIGVKVNIVSETYNAAAIADQTQEASSSIAIVAEQLSESLAGSEKSVQKRVVKRRKRSVLPPLIAVNCSDNYDSVMAVINAVAAGEDISPELDDAIAISGTLPASDGLSESAIKSRTTSVRCGAEEEAAKWTAVDQSQDGSCPVMTTARIASPIVVPFGWKRELTDDGIVYCSPSDIRLESLNDVRQYLLTEGTCKCGLQCPLIVSDTFNFDASLPSRHMCITDVCRDADMTNLCNHKRKIIAMAAFQHSTGLSVDRGRMMDRSVPTLDQSNSEDCSGFMKQLRSPQVDGTAPKGDRHSTQIDSNGRRNASAIAEHSVTGIDRDGTTVNCTSPVGIDRVVDGDMTKSTTTSSVCVDSESLLVDARNSAELLTRTVSSVMAVSSSTEVIMSSSMKPFSALPSAMSQKFTADTPRQQATDRESNPSTNYDRIDNGYHNHPQYGAQQRFPEMSQNRHDDGRYFLDPAWNGDKYSERFRPPAGAWPTGYNTPDERWSPAYYGKRLMADRAQFESGSQPVDFIAPPVSLTSNVVGKTRKRARCTAGTKRGRSYGSGGEKMLPCPNIDVRQIIQEQQERIQLEAMRGGGRSGVGVSVRDTHQSTTNTCNSNSASFMDNPTAFLAQQTMLVNRSLPAGAGLSPPDYVDSRQSPSVSADKLDTGTCKSAKNPNIARLLNGSLKITPRNSAVEARNGGMEIASPPDVKAANTLPAAADDSDKILDKTSDRHSSMKDNFSNPSATYGDEQESKGKVSSASTALKVESIFPESQEKSGCSDNNESCDKVLKTNVREEQIMCVDEMNSNNCKAEAAVSNDEDATVEIFDRKSTAAVPVEFETIFPENSLLVDTSSEDTAKFPLTTSKFENELKSSGVIAPSVSTNDSILSSGEKSNGSSALNSPRAESHSLLAASESIQSLVTSPNANLKISSCLSPPSQSSSPLVIPTKESNSSHFEFKSICSELHSSSTTSLRTLAIDHDSSDVHHCDNVIAQPNDTMQSDDYKEVVSDRTPRDNNSPVLTDNHLPCTIITEEARHPFQLSDNQAQDTSLVATTLSSNISPESMSAITPLSTKAMSLQSTIASSLSTTSVSITTAHHLKMREMSPQISQHSMLASVPTTTRMTLKKKNKKRLNIAHETGSRSSNEMLNRATACAAVDARIIITAAPATSGSSSPSAIDPSPISRVESMISDLATTQSALATAKSMIYADFSPSRRRHKLTARTTASSQCNAVKNVSCSVSDNVSSVVISGFTASIVDSDTVTKLSGDVAITPVVASCTSQCDNPTVAETCHVARMIISLDPLERVGQIENTVEALTTEVTQPSAVKLDEPLPEVECQSEVKPPEIYSPSSQEHLEPGRDEAAVEPDIVSSVSHSVVARNERLDSISTDTTGLTESSTDDVIDAKDEDEIMRTTGTQTSTPASGLSNCNSLDSADQDDGDMIPTTVGGDDDDDDDNNGSRLHCHSIENSSVQHAGETASPAAAVTMDNSVQAELSRGTAAGSIAGPAAFSNSASGAPLLTLTQQPQQQVQQQAQFVLPFNGQSFLQLQHQPVDFSQLRLLQFGQMMSAAAMVNANTAGVATANQQPLAASDGTQVKTEGVPQLFNASDLLQLMTTQAGFAQGHILLPGISPFGGATLVPVMQQGALGPMIQQANIVGPTVQHGNIAPMMTDGNMGPMIQQGPIFQAGTLGPVFHHGSIFQQAGLGSVIQQGSFTPVIQHGSLGPIIQSGALGQMLHPGQLIQHSAFGPMLQHQGGVYSPIMQQQQQQPTAISSNICGSAGAVSSSSCMQPSSATVAIVSSSSSVVTTSSSFGAGSSRLEAKHLSSKRTDANQTRVTASSSAAFDQSVSSVRDDSVPPDAPDSTVDYSEIAGGGQVSDEEGEDESSDAGTDTDSAVTSTEVARSNSTSSECCRISDVTASNSHDVVIGCEMRQSTFVNKKRMDIDALVDSDDTCELEDEYGQFGSLGSGADNENYAIEGNSGSVVRGCSKRQRSLEDFRALSNLIVPKRLRSLRANFAQKRRRMLIARKAISSATDRTMLTASAIGSGDQSLGADTAPPNTVPQDTTSLPSTSSAVDCDVTTTLRDIGGVTRGRDMTLRHYKLSSCETLQERKARLRLQLAASKRRSTSGVGGEKRETDRCKQRQAHSDVDDDEDKSSCTQSIEDDADSTTNPSSVVSASASPRSFNVGDLVWGPMRGFPSWPGKLVPETEVRGTPKAVMGKIWVRWFGDHSFALIEPDQLKTLSEGLETHHNAQNVTKHRKGRKMTANLEAAIQEAMIELDRQMEEQRRCDAAASAAAASSDERHEKTKPPIKKNKK